MNAPIDHAALLEVTRPSPALRRNRAGRVFDLPPVLHIATFAGFFVYLGILWSALAHRELVIPFAIFAVFLAASFVVPALWSRIAPPAGPVGDFADFLREGFECATGHLTAGQTIAQVMIMPAMLIGWGIAVAIIVATL